MLGIIIFSWYCQRASPNSCIVLQFHVLLLRLLNSPWEHHFSHSAYCVVVLMNNGFEQLSHICRQLDSLSKAPGQNSYPFFIWYWLFLIGLLVVYVANYIHTLLLVFSLIYWCLLKTDYITFNIIQSIIFSFTGSAFGHLF